MDHTVKVWDVRDMLDVLDMSGILLAVRSLSEPSRTQCKVNQIAFRLDMFDRFDILDTPYQTWGRVNHTASMAPAEDRNMRSRSSRAVRVPSSSPWPGSGRGGDIESLFRSFTSQKYPNLP